MKTNIRNQKVIGVEGQTQTTFTPVTNPESIHTRWDYEYFIYVLFETVGVNLHWLNKDKRERLLPFLEYETPSGVPQNAPAGISIIEEYDNKPAEYFDDFPAYDGKKKRRVMIAKVIIRGFDYTYERVTSAHKRLGFDTSLHIEVGGDMKTNSGVRLESTGTPTTSYPGYEKGEIVSLKEFVQRYEGKITDEKMERAKNMFANIPELKLTNYKYYTT